MIRDMISDHPHRYAPAAPLYVVRVDHPDGRRFEHEPMTHRDAWHTYAQCTAPERFGGHPSNVRVTLTRHKETTR